MEGGDIRSRSNSIIAEENRSASAISRTVQSVVDIIMSEDFRETSDNECLYCGTSIMGLGPAWTMYACYVTPRHPPTSPQYAYTSQSLTKKTMVPTKIY